MNQLSIILGTFNATFLPTQLFAVILFYFLQNIPGIFCWLDRTLLSYKKRKRTSKEVCMALLVCLTVRNYSRIVILLKGPFRKKCETATINVNFNLSLVLYFPNLFITPFLWSSCWSQSVFDFAWNLRLTFAMILRICGKGHEIHYNIL